MKYLMYSHTKGMTWHRTGVSSTKAKITAVVTSLAAAATLMFAGIASASNGPVPSVTITAIGGQSVSAGTVNISVPMLPTQVSVDGNGSVDSGTINGVSLELSDNTVDFYGPTNYWASSGNVDAAPFSVPWNITSAGNHTIIATVKTANNPDSDTVLAAVTVNMNVTVCPAAPAIAGDYMKNVLRIKASSKTFSNIINQVAHQTGSNGTLWAANACNVGYATMVTTYVDSLLP